MCKDKGRISANAKTLEDLDDNEMTAYKRAYKTYFDSYLQVWKRLIFKSLEYRKPNLVNANLIDDNLERMGQKYLDSPLYVYVCFMKAGRNYYSVEIPEANVRFVHRCLAKCRVEEVPQYSSTNKLTFVERQFKKETSVFAPWVEDNPKLLEKCCDMDFKYWRIPNMVKNDEDRAQLEKLVRDNFSLIKNNFLYAASLSSFPFVTPNEVYTFAKQVQLLDKVINVSILGILFEAADFSTDAQDNIGGKALNRKAFVELLVRIAAKKYIENGDAKTYSEAFKRLLEEKLRPYGWHNEWQSFRDKFLWKAEVNDIFEANLPFLKEIHAKYKSEGTVKTGKVML